VKITPVLNIRNNVFHYLKKKSSTLKKSFKNNNIKINHSGKIGRTSDKICTLSKQQSIRDHKF
jgi:hypothetical protein